MRLESIFTAVKPGKSDIESQRKKNHTENVQTKEYQDSADINSRTKHCKVNLDESLSC